MEYETYDPEKHGDLFQRESLWRELFEAANQAAPDGIVVTAAPRSSVYRLAVLWGYGCKTRALADGSGFVLWAEKLPDPLSEKLP